MRLVRDVELATKAGLRAAESTEVIAAMKTWLRGQAVLKTLSIGRAARATGTALSQAAYPAIGADGGTGRSIVLIRRPARVQIAHAPAASLWLRDATETSRRRGSMAISLGVALTTSPAHPANQEPPMAETKTKTKPTGASVDAYLASRASPEQLADCKAIMAMCKRVTRQQPKMWGPSIVGYGSYTYRYESGHSGNTCLAGFAVRGKELVVYLLAENPEQVELLAKLGRHKMGKACLYFKRLADLDVKVLEALIAGSVAEGKRRYPDTDDA
jgi:hypothetical protein